MCWLVIPQCIPTSKRRATYHLHSLKNKLKKTFEIVHYLPDMVACVCNPSTLEAETGQQIQETLSWEQKRQLLQYKSFTFPSFFWNSVLADVDLLCNQWASRTFDFPDSTSQQLDYKPVPLCLCWGLNPGQRHVRLTLYQLNCTTSPGKYFSSHI